MGRTRIGGIVVATLAAAGAAACGGNPHIETEAPPPVTRPAPVDFMEVRNSWILDFSQNQPDVAAQYYAPDAVVQFYGDTFSGADAIHDWLAQQLPRIQTLNVESAKFDVAGDTVTERADYSGAFLADGGVQDVAGTFVAVWTKNADGEWRVRELTIR